MSAPDLRDVVRTDVRFLLPEPIASVELRGDARALSAAFELVGVEVVPHGGRLVYAMAPADGDAVVVEGRDAHRELRRSGLAVRSFLPLPSLEFTSVIVPLDQPRPAGYAIRNWGGRPDRLRALRNRVAPALIARGLAPPGRARLTIGLRRPAAPFLLEGARELGVPAGAEFFLSPGGSDLLSRGVLHVFAPGAREPGWAVKFSRLPGGTAPFEREEAGLRLAEAAGPPVAAHAPRLLGRFTAGGVPASVETAAPGERLVSLLESTDSRASKLAALDRVAAWIVDVGRRTAEAGALGPELERLRTAVLPRGEGASETLLDGLGDLPAVFVHHDLGSWNILVRDGSFTAVDWEGARRHGAPLWDLVYFLAHAVIPLDRVPVDSAADAMVDLFLGRHPSSAYVLGWIRRAAADLAIPAEAVGRLAATSWLHHGLSQDARHAAVTEAGGLPSQGFVGLPAQMARRWLAEPGLGAGWSAWR